MARRIDERSKDAVLRLDYIDRIALLTCSLLDHSSTEPVKAVLSLVELIARLSQHLGSNDARYRLAEALRNCADRAERDVELLVKD